MKDTFISGLAFAFAVLLIYLMPDVMAKVQESQWYQLLFLWRVFVIGQSIAIGFYGAILSVVTRKEKQ